MSAGELAIAKGQRGSLKAFMKRAMDHADRLVANPPNMGVVQDVLLEEVESCLTELTDLSSQFESANREILNLMEKAGKDEDVLEQEASESTELSLELKQRISKLSAMQSRIERQLISKDNKASLEIEKQRLKIESTRLEAETKEFKRRQEKDEARRNTVKLPELDFEKFFGDVLKWHGFWDSFQAAVDRSDLKDVQKLNYLRSKLDGDAKSVIMGLDLTDSNYAEAVSLLEERYGNTETVVNAHYVALMNVPQSSNSTTQLRGTFDSLERHLRSLKALGQDENQQSFVSLIMSKFPRAAIERIEMNKDRNDQWTVASLRKALQNLISAREVSDRHSAQKTGTTPTDGSIPIQKKGRQLPPPSPFPETGGSAQALLTATGGETSKTGQMTQQNTLRGCVYCSEKHWSDQCKKFPDIDSRKAQIKGKLCYNCLRQGHGVKTCPTFRSCYYCTQKHNHHRSLCPKQFPSVSTEKTLPNVSSPAVTEKKTEAGQKDRCLFVSDEQAIYPTAVAEVKNPRNSTVSAKARIGFDTFSSKCYITFELAKKLQMKLREWSTLSVYTFNSSKAKECKTANGEVELIKSDGSSEKIPVQIVETIISEAAVSRAPIDFPDTTKRVLNTLKLADPLPDVESNEKIDLLLGVKYFGRYTLPERVKLTEDLYLINSKFGWMFAGSVKTGKIPVDSTHITATPREDFHDESMSFLTFENQNQKTLHQFERVDSLSPNLEDYWSLETVGIKDSPYLSDDDKALENFNATVVFSEGRYQTTWPWKEDSPDLPDNYGLCLGRLGSLLKRFQDELELYIKYNDIVQDQLQKTIVETVEDDDNSDGKLVHYIPHHPIITPQKTTTKVRMVFDASAKKNRRQKSLNECLFRGPVILEDLCGLLMRFRLHLVALLADIEKAFLQLGLQLAARDVVRFLWLKDPSKLQLEGNVQKFRFTRVCFGVISSPFLLGATVDHHLSKYGTPTAEKIRRNIYVDNVITGTDSESDAENFYAEAKQIFQEAGMNLREWTSNNKSLLEKIPEHDRVKNDVVSVLGLTWLVNSDQLIVPGSMHSKMNSAGTKREALQAISSVFDPLGLFSPLMVGVKIFIQDLWKAKMDWDQPFSDSQKSQWNQLSSDLSKISTCKLSRCVTVKDANQYDLLCFVDASTQAFTANVYLRSSNLHNSVEVHLLISKSRLATVKTITLPRLELLSLWSGSKLMKFVEKQLRLPIGHKIFWSDSQCVLSWLTSKNKLTVFVRNRLEEIKSSEDVTFRYIPTSENPADLGTRNCSWDNFENNSLWWHGPEWLTTNFDSWPLFDFPPISPAVLEQIESETKGPSVLYEVGLPLGEGSSTETETTKNEEKLLNLDPANFSSLNRLLRVSAWTLRFVNKLLKRKCGKGELSATEIQHVKMMWIRHVQRKHYGDVIRSITEGKKNMLQKQLGLKLDTDGLLRCHGRMINADQSDNTLFPKLLPQRDSFTSLVVQSVHSLLYHVGVAHTVAQLRLEFWIPKARTMVKGVLLKCQRCRRYEGGPFKAPDFAPWPKFRVARSAPFSFVGVDYFGPLVVKDSWGSSKVWVCLYTCLAVRAIHLELVRDLSAEHFLYSFRRFIARRGKPIQMTSDNGGQFKLTQTAVEKLWNQVVTDDSVSSYIAKEGIKWNFIPELTPWMGGMYERLVGLGKRALRKSVGRIFLSFEQLRTVLSEIEAVINYRPLVYVGSDFEERWTLSPADFLSLNPKIGFPGVELNLEDPDYHPGTLSSTDQLLETWKKGQAHLDHFWKVWSEDYLLSLRERTQTHLKTPRVHAKFQPKVGDVVLIKELNMPRGTWKLARIQELNTSSDGLVRSAQLTLPSGKTLTRSVTFLFPLECTAGDNVQDLDLTADADDNGDHNQPTTSQADTVKRPQRKAAEAARQKLAKWAARLQ